MEVVKTDKVERRTKTADLGETSKGSKMAIATLTNKKLTMPNLSDSQGGGSRIVDKHRTVNLGDLRREFKEAQAKQGPSANGLVSLDNELAWLTSKLDKKDEEFKFDEGAWGKSKLIYVPDDNGKKVIQGGTPGDLVSFLVENNDNDFMEGFLFVHTYFVPSKFLFAKLEELFRANEQQGSLSRTQERILEVVSAWVAHHWYFFARDPELLEKLNEFLNSLMQDVNIKDTVGALKLNRCETLKDLVFQTKLFTRLSESYVSYNREKLSALVTSLLLKSPIVKHSKKRLQTVHCVIASEASEFLVKQLSVTKEEAVNLARGLVELGYLKHATNDLKSFVDGNHLYKIKEKRPKQEKDREKKSEKEQKDKKPTDFKSFMDIPAMEAACQLTHLESSLFRRVAPNELMHQSWNSKDNATPNLSKLIARFNEVSYWVASEIVSVENLKNRVEVVKRFITIAEYVRQLNNFSTMMEIVVGLNLASVQRLEKTWVSIPPKYMQIYNSLMALTSSSQNYKAYREATAGLQAPIVPYIGVYLRDLTFIEDGNETLLNKTKIVNYEKMRMLQNIFREMTNFQALPYPFKEDPSIMKYLTQDRVMFTSDEELRNHSVACEPSKRHSLAIPDSKSLQYNIEQAREAKVAGVTSSASCQYGDQPATREAKVSASVSSS